MFLHPSLSLMSNAIIIHFPATPTPAPFILHSCHIHTRPHQHIRQRRHPLHQHPMPLKTKLPLRLRLHLDTQTERGGRPRVAHGDAYGRVFFEEVEYAAGCFGVGGFEAFETGGGGGEAGELGGGGLEALFGELGGLGEDAQAELGGGCGGSETCWVVVWGDGFAGGGFLVLVAGLSIGFVAAGRVTRGVKPITGIVSAAVSIHRGSSSSYIDSILG
mmetsp:Transcript_40568/g.73143  ORF Transcript_40568/g.73143 Transcript_40568/m.73143 type:complete len:217 (-) Transcript_40568:1413-2063(-)